MTDLAAGLPRTPRQGYRQPEGPTLLPPPELVPEVLPTDRLGPTGRPTGELRAQLYRIPDLRNALSVVGVWAQSVGVLALAAWIDHPLAWVAAFLLMGRAYALFAILSHEAAHRLLFSNRRANDAVGRWLLAYPAFVPLDAYRRGHMAHHRDEMGPDEPDVLLYAGYPITAASWWRKLRRDAFGSSGWKNLKALLLAFRSPSSRPIAVRIGAAQLVLLAAGVAVGRWWLWPLFWLLPWMTVWRVLNRLRAVAEHGGMIRSDDRRLTTHVVRQSWLARFWFVPFNTGWHLAHHVDIGVPFRNLPRFHAELEAAGYVPPGLERPSYLALWRAARSRPTA